MRIIINQQKSEVLLSEEIMQVLEELRIITFPYPCSQSNGIWYRCEVLCTLNSIITGAGRMEDTAHLWTKPGPHHSPFLSNVVFGVLSRRKDYETVMSTTSCKMTCVSCLWAMGLQAIGVGSRDLPLEDRPWPLTQYSFLRGIDRRLCPVSLVRDVFSLSERMWGAERQVDAILWVSVELRTEGENAFFHIWESGHFRGKDTEAQNIGNLYSIDWNLKNM